MLKIWTYTEKLRFKSNSNSKIGYNFFFKKNVIWKGKDRMKKKEKVQGPRMEKKRKNNYQFLKYEKMIDIYK